MVDGLQVFEDLFASLPDSVTLSVAVRNASGRATDMRLLRMNRSAQSALHDPDSATGGLCSELWPQMVVNGSFDACLRVLDTGMPESGAFWWTENHTHRSVGYEYRAARVGTELLLWVLRDNTDLVQQPRYDAARFQAAFDGAPAGMAMITGTGQIVLANVTLASMLHADSDRLVGTPLASWIDPTDRPVVSTALAAMAGDGTITSDVEVRLVAEGSVAEGGAGTSWARMSISRLTVEDDWSNCFIVHLLDITVQKSIELDLSRHALHDHVTNLANRALLIDRLQSALTRLGRRRTLVGVIFVGVDPFMVVDHSSGQPTDDIVLREVAGQLQRLSRPGDTVARFSSDEFVLVREDLDGDAEVHELTAIIREVFGHPVSIDGRSMSLTVTVGATSSGDSSTRAHELIRDAQLAMHRAQSPAQEPAAT